MRALVPALLLLSLPSSAAQLVPGSIAFHSPAGQALLQSGSTELGTYFALAEAYTTQVRDNEGTCEERRKHPLTPLQR